MKTKKALLMFCLCLHGACSEKAIAPVTDLSAFAGEWIVCGANDGIPYLTIHDDGTLEAWYWSEDDTVEHGELLFSGAYNFDESTTSFSFPDDDAVYTLHAWQSDSYAMSSDLSVAVPAWTTLLLLEGQPTGDYDTSIVYLPLSTAVNADCWSEDGAAIDDLSVVTGPWVNLNSTSSRPGLSSAVLP